MLISYDLLFAKKGYLVGTILKGTEILECEDIIVNKEKPQKNGK